MEKNSRDCEERIALHGLFQVKNLEVGASRFLYIHTYPEEGVTEKKRLIKRN